MKKPYEHQKTINMKITLSTGKKHYQHENKIISIKNLRTGKITINIKKTLST